VTRADQYSVDKSDGTTDIYLPVAINIFFTNILTGEVLYSASNTSYVLLTETQVDYKNGQSKQKILPAYKDKLFQVIKDVLTDASKNFTPLEIKATIVEEWKGYFVLNKGIDSGISVGQELNKENGAGLKIIYSGKSYSVGVPMLGEFKEKDELSAFTTMTVSDVKKPRVMIIDADTPPDMPGAYASTQFAEELGGKASFIIIPVNPDFSNVLQDIASNQGLQQTEVTQKRELPNYFLRLKVLTPIVYELATSQDYGKQRVFEASAFAELLDKTGRVLYSTVVHEEIRDTVLTNGMAFDLQVRNKVLYGNLLKTLSNKFIKDVRFDRNELKLQKVTSKNNGADYQAEIQLFDQAGLLATNQNVQIMHRLENISSIEEKVAYIPTWSAHVAERNGNIATLQSDMSMSNSFIQIQESTDFALIESSGKSTQSRLSFALCEESKDIGTINLPELKDVAYFSLGNVFHQPFFGSDYSVSAKHLTFEKEMESFENSGFKPREKSVPIAPQYCLSPLLKVTEIDRKCSESGLCEFSLNIIAGVQIISAAKIKGFKKLLGIDYKVTNVPLGSLNLFLKRKIFLKSIELFPDVIKQLDLSNL